MKGRPPAESLAATSESVYRVEPVRISSTGDAPRRDPGEVVAEELLTIMIEDVGSFAVMCTPCDVKAFAVGFAFSEGMISSADDVLQYTERHDPFTVAMRLDEPEQVISSRNLIVTSSCGLCGSRNIDNLLAGTVTCKDTLRMSVPDLCRIAREMHKQQDLFERTGGAHAAAIFSADGEIISFAEDIGRHNALDKVIGKSLAAGQSLEQRGVMLSGRVSLELVAKTARAGIEVLAAISAPSSLAMRAAQRCNITLCCFVRGDRTTVYTHPHRISDMDGFSIT